MDKEDIKYLTNRQKRRLFKAGLYWCACDKDLVSDGIKCKVCGARCGKRRDKKS